MACGTPVAAYPVTGPIDVVDQGQTGWLDDDLSQAIEHASKLDRKEVYKQSQKWTWKASAEDFVKSLKFIY
jgi:glycosyltransferase involved in cell wall biosynthesis